MIQDVSLLAPGATDPADLVASGTQGTYTLVLALSSPVTLDVGALGTHEFDAGAYAYTGSAFGTGGFSRVERHRRVAAGDHDVRHWHVDYLTGAPETRLRAVALSPDADVECDVARSLPAGPVSGFGASDCDCETHLAFAPDLPALRRAVVAAHDRLG